LKGSGNFNLNLRVTINYLRGSKACKVLFPFDRQEVFLFVVAFLAGSDNIAFDRFATPDDRH